MVDQMVFDHPKWRGPLQHRAESVAGFRVTHLVGSLRKGQCDTFAVVSMGKQV